MRAESTLENWGNLWHAAVELTDTFSVKSITAYRELEWSGSRDADNTGLLVLHTDYSSCGRSVQPGVAGTHRHRTVCVAWSALSISRRPSTTSLVPFAAPPPLVASGAIPGSLDYQRAFIDNDNLAVVHAVDVQRHRRVEPHRRCSLHRGNARDSDPRVYADATDRAPEHTDHAQYATRWRAQV